MSRRLTWAAAAAASFAVFLSGPALAATINYGDFEGKTVVYLDVSEANSEPNLLFSAPTVVGDSLKFDPVNFFAEVDPGAGTQITDSEIVTVIEALPGFFIDNIQISEQGDLTLVGLPGAFGIAQVGAAFFFEVLAVDGVLVGDGPMGHVNMQFTTGGGPNGGEYALPGDAGTAVPWSGTAFLDIGAAMAASPFSGQQATSVRLSFDNSLAAAADANASSFIKKKQIGGIIIRTNIPEPSTFILAASVLVAAGLGLARRRSR
jgi:hypothetical protein